MPDGSLQGGLAPKRGPGRPRKLRTPENAELICSLTEQGVTLPEIARRIGYCNASKITDWLRDDREGNNGALIAARYARAQEARWALLADGLLDLAARDCSGPDGRPDNALVQQLRLEVDTRKWLLSKMLPRQFGDKIEISGDPDAPVVSRIELVAVHPREPLTIDAVPSEGTHNPQKR